MASVNVPIRSLTSEFSHLLMTFPILASNTNFKYLLLVPYVFHALRYYRHFDTALEIQKEQRNLWVLTLIDYFIIIFHTTQRTSKIVTCILGILSGVISYYFAYNTRTKLPKESKLNSILVDIVMMTFLIPMLDTNNQCVLFFIISDLVYHILEQVI